MKTEKILAYIGFAAASRTAVFGTEPVLAQVRKQKKDTCVVMANDVSERTKKQITDKCTFYKVPLVFLPCSMDGIGQRTGKEHPVAVVAVTNPSLTGEILKCTEENSQ